MYNEKYVAAIIVAAGSGTRMGGISKPFIKIGGKTLFESVFDAFNSAKYVDEIVVVCSDSEKFAQITDMKTSDKKLVFAPGGSNRTQSVYNGVSHATKRTRLIAIHDCARPFVTCEMIDTLIEKTAETGASSACTKVTDTIKYHDTENGITYTPERSNLLAIQTPQCFDIDIYRVSLATSLRDGNIFTDETSMVEKAGYKVEYVETGRKNIKLTTTEDVIIAKAFFASDERAKKKQEG